MQAEYCQVLKQINIPNYLHNIGLYINIHVLPAMNALQGIFI